MREKKIILIIVLSLFFVAGFSGLDAKKKKPKLARKYSKWLKEEVVYIITPTEKKVFLQLESDREREMFMQAFWKQRDPNQHTPENEFKDEHYKRIAYAMQHLGRGTPTAGWRTEMGRIYIILGEPNSISRFENRTEMYPTVIWFYQGLAKYGLPQAFNVVFFKQHGSGDYTLYSPVIHGPKELMVHYQGDVNDYLSAYNALAEIDPNVAKVSINLVEGESDTLLRPSLSSDILIGKQIPASPTRRVNDDYAAKLLKYKQFIDVDYSVNYIPSSSMVRVIRDDASGFFFVHYLIEPKKLSIEKYDDTFYSNLEINGSVMDTKDKPIFQFTKSVPIKLVDQQFQQIRGKLFSFQDMFPLIEGTYKLNILLRNTVSKEFTSIEKTVTIPKIDKPVIGPLVLAHTAKKEPGLRNSDKSFRVGDVQLLPSPRNDFVAADTMYVYYQLHGITDQQREKGHVKYTLYKNDEAFHTVEKDLKDYSDLNNVLEKFPLEGYSAAYYAVRVSLYADDSRFLALGEESFYISPIGSLARPWVVSLSSPANSPEHLKALGLQYANADQDEKSMDYLSRAYNRNPQIAHVALDYCRILNKLKMYRKVLDVGTPFMEREEKHNFYALMGFAAEALGEYQPAIKYYKDYLEYHGTNVRILNSIGNSYHRLGEVEEALVAWEKSLELFPEQERLKKIVETLKKNKKAQPAGPKAGKK